MSDHKRLSWTAKMNDDSYNVVALEFYREGEMRQKNISFHDFVAMLNESTENDAGFRIGKLPNGYYDGSVCNSQKMSFQCVIVVPAGKRVIQYYETFYEVPYPATVFAFHVMEGRLHASEVFFVESNEPTDDDILYQYCFANVESGTGSICWGSNDLPELTCLKDCDKLVALFFGSPCNDDYYSRSRFASKVPEYCQTQRALYEHLKECEEFPFEILLSVGKRMGDLIT